MGKEWHTVPKYHTETHTCDLWGSPDPDLMIRSSHEIKSICVSRLHVAVAGEGRICTRRRYGY